MSSLLIAVLAACHAPADKPTLAAYRPPAAGTFTVYDTLGEHGRAEAERRKLDGRLFLVSFEDRGYERIAGLFEAAPQTSLKGCPLVLATVLPDKRLVRDTEFDHQMSFPCKLLWDVVFPPGLPATDEGVRDVFTQVRAIECSVPASLKVQTIPNRTDAGWVRTEKLAVPTDEIQLPPGRGKLTNWEAKYAVDADGFLTLADVTYLADVPTQDDLKILIRGNVARASTRPLTANEKVRIVDDFTTLKDIARLWPRERSFAMVRLKKWKAESSGSVFAGQLDMLEKRLQQEIDEFGEQEPPHHIQMPGVERDARVVKPTDEPPKTPPQ